MNVTTKPVLFSLKPRYADLVFEGLKHAELRRRLTPDMKDRDVFIYVSSPVRQLRGGFRVGHVWHGSPKDVWKEVSGFAGVKKRDFDNYYSGRTVAYALKITGVWEYVYPASLQTLRDRFPHFVVPQSWRYVKPEEYRSFQKMMRRTKKARHLIKYRSSIHVDMRSRRTG